MSLTPKQRQYLKGLGHSQKSVIHVGKEGLTEGVVASISKALDDHELIKVTILETADIARKSAEERISKAVQCDVVQTLGKKMLLYRKNPKAPSIKFPA